MAKFFVLHLSDLHICDMITVTLEKLIDSISNNDELKKNNLIIVITGDIINRANYEKYEDTAVDFFELLKKALVKSGIYVSDIIIVPGNHDKKTDASNKLYSIAQQSGFDFTNRTGVQSHLPSEEEIFKLQSSGFENYLELCNKIFKIFGIKDKEGNIKTYSSTFGVEVVTIETTKIIFIRLNSAISCYGSPGDSEKYRLTVGKYQLSLLKKDYRKEKISCSADTITFGLSHHPISYMVSKEATIINKYLISEDLLNVDFFLSGHIHDGSLSNLSNHNRSMISLETGIGWPDDPETTHKDHRYAIYCFDEEKNIFCSSMYKTNQANEFCIDSDYLLTKQEKQDKKIYNPLKTRDYAFISLNDFETNNKQYLFVNSDSINTLKLLFSTISKFSAFCTKLLPDYLNRYIDLLLRNKNTLIYTRNELKNFFSKNLGDSIENFDPTNGFANYIKTSHSIRVDNSEKLLYNLFISYLQHICDNFYNSFKDYFDQDSECRAVFRIYNPIDDVYIPIAVSPADLIEPRGPNVTNKSGRPRNYNYEKSLIEYAYNKKRSLVYSINAQNHNFTPDNWDDFIVIVPDIDNYPCRDKKGRFATRPSIAFVFSVRLKNQNNEFIDEYKEKHKKQAQRLYLLQFSEVENIISSVIMDFFEQIPINIQKFINKYSKND